MSRDNSVGGSLGVTVTASASGHVMIICHMIWTWFKICPWHAQRHQHNGYNSKAPYACTTNMQATFPSKNQ